MKVLFISHSSGLAGAERCMLESVKSLQMQNIDVACIVPSTKGALVSELKGINAEVYEVSFPWWMSDRKGGTLKVFNFFYKSAHLINSLLFSFIPLFKKIKPDVVITNSIVIPIGALAAKLTNVPHVWYIHEFGEEDHLLNFTFGRKFSLNFINKYSDRVLVNSKIVATKFREYVQPEKIEIINYVVDNKFVDSGEKINSGDSKAFNVLLAGRIAENKRQEDAVKALRVLKDKGLNIKLTLLGYNPSEYAISIKNLIDTLELANDVNLVGFTNNPLPVFSAADLVLVCSTNEAFGRITIEAMKLGKPVVGANGGATPELIKDFKNGLLYRPKDAEDLAAKIQYCYDNPQIISEMNKNAQDWALSTFNYENHGSDLKKQLNLAINAFSGI